MVNVSIYTIHGSYGIYIYIYMTINGVMFHDLHNIDGDSPWEWCWKNHGILGTSMGKQQQSQMEIGVI